jgi:protein-S-isoprenylcysteine O-methyltransferase Ste14
MKLKKQDFIYVIVQFVLFALYVVDFFVWKINGPSWLRYVGLIWVLIGILFAAIALLQLNTYLSPFPTPKKGSSLIKTGVFKYARHPIYGGILLSFLGTGIYFSSGYKIVVTGLLLILFYFKSQYEERRLTVLFPEYTIYKKHTRRFL